MNHRSVGLGTLPSGIKVAVLIDAGSASASEIVAGALQDQGIAKVFGVKSFGKGSVQELVPLDDGSSLKVTIAKWYTPKGNSISEVGLKPDIKVEISDADATANKDSQLDKALETVKAMPAN